MKSVFEFLSYSREIYLLLSYSKVEVLIKLIKASNEIYTVSEIDNSLSFFTIHQAEFFMTNISQAMILKIYLQKILIDFLKFFMTLCRINKTVYLLEHANTRNHVYQHNCSSVRVFLSILTHLAQSFFFYYFKYHHTGLIGTAGANRDSNLKNSSQCDNLNPVNFFLFLSSFFQYLVNSK